MGDVIARDRRARSARETPSDVIDGENLSGCPVA